MRRVVLISSASASGKTTLAKELARRFEVPFHELDALNHGAGWTEATPDELRAAVEPLVAGECWVIDGSYRGKLGDLVLAAADTVVWLDLPLRTWLPRLLRRTTQRIVLRETLWNGNRETFRGALSGRDALIPFALRNYPRRRRLYPVELAPYRVVRLRSTAEVERWLAGLTTRGVESRDRAGRSADGFRGSEATAERGLGKQPVREGRRVDRRRPPRCRRQPSPRAG